MALQLSFLLEPDEKSLHSEMVFFLAGKRLYRVSEPTKLQKKAQKM